MLGRLLKSGKKTFQYLESLFVTSWANRCPSGFQAESLVMSCLWLSLLQRVFLLSSFYLTIEGHILGGQDQLGRFGALPGAHIRMNGRLRGRVSPPSEFIPGQWTCGVCGMEGCWPAITKCYRCAAPRSGAPPSEVPFVVHSESGPIPANLLLPSQFR